MSSNNLTNDSTQNKSEGQWHSTKGSLVEAVGNVIGSTEWQQSGAREHQQGEAQYKAGQGQGYVQGLSDQLTGYKDSVVGAVTGNTSQQTSGNIQREAGEAERRVNRPS